MKPISDEKKVAAGQIKGILKRLGQCELDTLCAECADFTWNQIFTEIDRMSRTGEVLLRKRGSEIYVVSLPLLSEHDATSSHS